MVSAPSPQPGPAALKVPANPLMRALARCAVWLLALLSDETRLTMARALGLWVYRIGIRRRVTLENLQNAYPELPLPERERIARGAYANMATAVVEALVSDHIPDAELDERLTLENWDRVETAFAQGKGVLVATAHFGNWELLGELLSRKGYPLHAVVRPLRGALNAHVMENRLKSGMKLIAPRGAISQTLKSLHAGAAVAFLMDQGLSSKSALFVPFFGRPAATTPALSIAALRSGAPVLVVMAAREGRRLRVSVEGPFFPERTGDRDRDLQTHTARVTAAIEAVIRRNPEQWLWLHRRWKYTPPLG